MQEAHYLTRLFEPKSVAVIGASEREGSIGNLVFRNLLCAGYSGALYPINPGHATILGATACKSVEDIGNPIDLAIITTRPALLPDLLKRCARSGIHNVAITTPFGSDRSGAVQTRKTLEIARRYGLRLLGPASYGIARPAIRLNATLSGIPVAPGHLALVSQSASVCATTLDWASANRVGFSCVAGPGGTYDIGFGEILDYLAGDTETRAIALCVANVRNARRFMSGLTAAARVKPVIVLKAVDMTNESSDYPPDHVFDAAIKRAGAVRAGTLGEWLDAAKALASGFPLPGQRLAILGNGRFPIVLAAGHARERGTPLARLAPKTAKALAALATNGAHGNPVDIGDDATPARYAKAVATIAADNDAESVLAIFAPQTEAASLETAHALIDQTKIIAKPMIACWMGETQALAARALLSRNDIPAFARPETAVDLHAILSAIQYNQRRRQHIPTSEPRPTRQETEGARLLIDAALQENRTYLSDAEAKAVLCAFRIPVVPTLTARTPAEAVSVAGQLGFPVAMTINMSDRTRQPATGKSRAKLATAAAVHEAFNDLAATMRREYPDASVDGVSITPQRERTDEGRLRIGIQRAPGFGLIVALDMDRGAAVGLPPFGRLQAEEMIETAHVDKLTEHPEHPPATGEKRRRALEDTLLRLSDMACELPWLQSLELDPRIDDEGIVIADAPIAVGRIPVDGDRYAHLAIHPYPAHLEREWTLPDGQTVCIRPIRPEDAELEQAFVRTLSDESKHYRFMDTLRELTPAMLLRFTQIDYDREMALIATIVENGQERQIGSARYMPKPDGKTVEFALAVADDWQRRGIGRELMSSLIDVARDMGYHAIVGDVLAMNSRMLHLTGSLGFTMRPHPEDPAVKRVIRNLDGKRREDRRVAPSRAGDGGTR